ncbi:hypothetical protein C8R43DRAFT_954163 [Mycena crocata]|nr:hypothetical protein C8R43DRAFT_954163 [Mycena crocata]
MSLRAPEHMVIHGLIGQMTLEVKQLCKDMVTYSPILTAKSSPMWSLHLTQLRITQNNYIDHILIFHPALGAHDRVIIHETGIIPYTETFPHCLDASQQIHCCLRNSFAQLSDAVKYPQPTMLITKYYTRCCSRSHCQTIKSYVMFAYLAVHLGQNGFVDFEWNFKKITSLRISTAAGRKAEIRSPGTVVYSSAMYTQLLPGPGVPKRDRPYSRRIQQDERCPRKTQDAQRCPSKMKYYRVRQRSMFNANTGSETRVTLANSDPLGPLLLWKEGDKFVTQALDLINQKSDSMNGILLRSLAEMYDIVQEQEDSVESGKVQLSLEVASSYLGNAKRLLRRAELITEIELTSSNQELVESSPHNKPTST